MIEINSQFNQTWW